MPEPQILLSLPPGGVETFQADGRYPYPRWQADCDPPGHRLGSGGGAAWLLFRAWQRQCQSKPVSFPSWLGQSHRVIIHAGGESRRLPAYAPGGKAMLPMPALRWSLGQHLEQTLLDVQLPFLTGLLRHTREPRLVIACGDVILQGDLTALPDADVVALGMWTIPEQASRHVVFFSPRDNHDQLAFVLQKPRPGRVKELSEDFFFLIDTGCWLLSPRAVMAMMRKAGWDERHDAFPDGPAFHDLYTDFGQSLGRTPSMPDEAISPLTAAVAPVQNGGFHHVGASRELISTTATLQNLKLEQDQDIGRYPRHPSVFIQNAVVETPLRSRHQNIWIENSHLGPQWQLTRDHVITGIPENNWPLALPPGVCLDLAPIGEHDLAVRVYDMDDAFRGPVADADTFWLGQPAQNWFTQRGLTCAACGIEAATDLQQAPLFPVLNRSQLDSGFLQWLCGAPPNPPPPNQDDDRLNTPAVPAANAAAPPETSTESIQDYARFYRDCRRVSAAELGDSANLARLSSQRRQFIRLCLPRLYAGGTRCIFLRLDLRRTAALWHDAGLELPEAKAVAGENLFAAARETMFRSEVLRRQGDAAKAAHEEHLAFAMLCEALAKPVRAEGVFPQCSLLEDQVLWTRSPIRLDLAGGWTDTPPQCFFAGGKVLNLAAEINGQPPLQCFIKRCQRPALIIRSIDLGCEEQIEHYEQLRQYTAVGSAFSIPKAALALCGFLPDFHASPPPTLADLLKSLGGGLELTMLSALPKGSGLGTSSILAATILGALNEVCGLGWTNQEIIRRTSVLEQLLTTGGGWQDQAGGIIPAVKLLETRAGLFQAPQPSWLPERMFVEHANHDMLLYYTGITRVAKDILHEVVRGMFLNDGQELAILAEMGAHAQALARQIQRGNWNAVGLGVRRSWELNCALDPGTNPPAVRNIFAAVQKHLLGAKLLGAGGGGYMLMIAKSETDAAKIRQTLADNPPNPRARFVSFAVSTTGLQVTRS